MDVTEIIGVVDHIKHWLARPDTTSDSPAFEADLIATQMNVFVWENSRHLCEQFG